jgi:hypothetical protein
MNGRIYPTLREATHETYSNHSNKQGLAWDLEWDKAEISNRTSQADAYRPFPADDPKERLVTFMQKTGDLSYLMTLADKLGCEIKIKADRLPELVQALTSEAKRLTDSIQLVLSTPWVQQQAHAKGKK